MFYEACITLIPKPDKEKGDGPICPWGEGHGWGARGEQLARLTAHSISLAAESLCAYAFPEPHTVLYVSYTVASARPQSRVRSAPSDGSVWTHTHKTVCEDRHRNGISGRRFKFSARFLFNVLFAWFSN